MCFLQLIRRNKPTERLCQGYQHVRKNRVITGQNIVIGDSVIANYLKHFSQTSIYSPHFLLRFRLRSSNRHNMAKNVIDSSKTKGRDFPRASRVSFHLVGRQGISNFTICASVSGELVWKERNTCVVSDFKSINNMKPTFTNLILAKHCWFY